MTTATVDPAIAERLRARRLELGISQETAARKIGASNATYSRWERSKAAPNEMSAHAISRALDIPLEDLLPDQGDEPIADERILGALAEIRAGMAALARAFEIVLSDGDGDATARSEALRGLADLQERAAAADLAAAFEEASRASRDS